MTQGPRLLFEGTAVNMRFITHHTEEGFKSVYLQLADARHV
jgi:hypothetical protein